jgi:mannose-6-phosphate isomerase-like protein (cupin superfamily)
MQREEAQERRFTAVVLATDTGDGLRPLTDRETPTSLLALGDRRPLLQRWAEHLLAHPGVVDLGVVVDARFLRQASACLQESAWFVSFSTGSGWAPNLVTELEEHILKSGSEAVLLQPAAQAVSDQAAYLRGISAAIAHAASAGVGVELVVGCDAESPCRTGIEAWPTALLPRRLSDGAVPASTSLEAEALPMEDAGWVDVSTWDDVRRLLAYVEKPWGHEELWALNHHYAGKLLCIREGESLSLQYHRVKDETIRMASGRMRLRVGASADALEEIVLDPGMAYAIPPGVVHQMVALEDCAVIEVSTPHLTDVVRLEDRYGRT